MTTFEMIKPCASSRTCDDAHWCRNLLDALQRILLDDVTRARVLVLVVDVLGGKVVLDDLAAAAAAAVPGAELKTLQFESLGCVPVACKRLQEQQGMSSKVVSDGL
jgi:hypothetical protein